MPYNIIHASSGVSLVVIKAVESNLGIRFPEDFVNLYKKANGGRPENRFYPVGGDFYGVHEIVPIISTAKDDDNMEKAYKALVKETRGFPGFLVPFASDSSGDYFCFSIRDFDYGAIFCYVHENSDDPDRMLVLLAPSLDAFFSGMRKFPE